MKSQKEIKMRLFATLAELRDGRIKVENPEYAKQLSIELQLLYDILEEDVPENFWEQIEEEISWRHDI